MFSFDNMSEAMSAFGIYDLLIGDVILRELECYSAVMDDVSDNIDDAIGECFIETAEESGLAEYEKIVGPVRNSLSLADRRNMIKSMIALTANDFTPSGLQRFFNSLGIVCDVVEDPCFYNILITPRARNYSSAEKRFIKERVAGFLPCHLDFVVEFRTANWNTYDSFSRSFDEWDSMNYSWNKLDEYNAG